MIDMLIVNILFFLDFFEREDVAALFGFVSLFVSFIPLLFRSTFYSVCAGWGWGCKIEGMVSYV